MKLPPVIIFGVDPAKTSLAAVAIHPGGFDVFTRTMPQDIAMCCNRADLWMERIIRETKHRFPAVTVHVFIEKALVGKGVNSTIVQAYVQGGLLSGAVAAGAMVTQVNQATWKLRITGKGSSGKPDVARHIEREWPKLYRASMSNGKPNQNLLDAGCIA
jgi:Holliday junction resolvasome RuvABC endonuclease subunit